LDGAAVVVMVEEVVDPVVVVVRAVALAPVVVVDMAAVCLALHRVLRPAIRRQ